MKEAGKPQIVPKRECRAGSYCRSEGERAWRPGLRKHTEAEILSGLVSTDMSELEIDKHPAVGTA